MTASLMISDLLFAEPPAPHPFVCTVCCDTLTEWTEEGPQSCTNRIHEEVAPTLGVERDYYDEDTDG